LIYSGDSGGDYAGDYLVVFAVGLGDYCRLSVESLI